MDFSAKEWADEDGHADILGDGGGDTCAPHAQVQPEDQKHIPEYIENAAGSKSQHGKECLALIAENVIHNAAGCHGWCCNKDPGAIFDRVRKDGVSASKETHEGSVEEKAKDANERATY